MKAALALPGLHPVGPCLARLFDREVMATSRTLGCEFAPNGLKAAILEEQAERVDARKFDLEYAACWELQTYGCILLAVNPYHQPQRYVTQEMAAAA